MNNKRNSCLGTLAVILVCIGGMAVLSEADCQRREFPPTAPVYPGSILVDEHLPGYRSPYAIASYDYISEDTRDDIFEFYRQYGTCGHGGSGSQCLGDTSPYGEYWVAVGSLKDGRTGIIMQIHWNSYCGVYID